MSRVLLLLLFLSVGCSHSVHLVQTSDFRPYEKLTAGKMVTAEAEQFVVMNFTTQTDYVNEARKNLIAKCANGDIQGITTRYSTSHGFLSWTNKIVMTGLCLN